MYAIRQRVHGTQQEHPAVIGAVAAQQPLRWSAAIAPHLNAHRRAAQILGNLERAVKVKDGAQARVRVTDHLHGWESIVPLYRAIFAFDLPEVVKRIQARTLELELFTQQEAHYGPQGKLLCDLVSGAEHQQLQNAVGLSMEYRPDEVVIAIRRFLCRV